VRWLPENVPRTAPASGPRLQVPSECGCGPFRAECAGHASPSPHTVAEVGGHPASRIHPVRAGGGDGQCGVPGFPPHSSSGRTRRQIGPETSLGWATSWVFLGKSPRRQPDDRVVKHHLRPSPSEEMDPQLNFPRISGEVGKGIPRDPHGRRTPAIGDISMAEATG